MSAAEGDGPGLRFRGDSGEFWCVRGMTRVETHATLIPMTVVLAPSDDARFQYAVATAIDRIAVVIGQRPDEIQPAPWFASALQDELRPYGDVRVTVIGDTVSVRRPARPR